jgi:hypothetical protein
MKTTPQNTGTNDWHAENQRVLVAELASIRKILERHAEELAASRDRLLPEVGLQTIKKPDRTKSKGKQKASSPADLCSRSPVPEQPILSSLDRLCAAFGLTSFERKLLLLCAGCELDSTFTSLCAAAQGDTRRTYPTFSLALSAFPDAHWSALRPTGPLRHWRLIEVGTGDTLASSSLRVDERTLHFLTGVDCLDERLFGLVREVTLPADLAQSQFDVAQRLAQVWTQSENTLVQIRSDDPAAAQAVVAAACALLQTQPLVLIATDVPPLAAEREALIRLWEREAIYSHSVLLVECDESPPPESAPALTAFLETIQGPVVVTCRDPLRLRHRSLPRFEVNKPTQREQCALWEVALGTAGRNLNGHIRAAVGQFNLGSQAIRAASDEVLEQLTVCAVQESNRVFWEACRAQSRLRLNDLAQRIEPKAGWDDLVLPSMKIEALRQIAVHVRRRTRVYDEWGFADKCARGLGISALFSGASGTGKTMAAEVLANELQLDLYRIDLSAMVSKYIGETEKNLRRVFDAAENGGAILLFDEADALFGKRSEVKDSHDRYANIEVSYLLQRMEAYRGLAILTTNMKSALDKAFMRRLRFVVQFPFPDAVQRAEIWRRAFPERTPIAADLDPMKLARLSVAGGNIRNIALNATFLAADSGEHVGMSHLLAATRSEYAKLEKSLTDGEIGGWV